MKTRTIDTNFLVRLLANDDSDQWATAAALSKSFHLIVLPTVILETEWVLRSKFKLQRSYILELFRGMLNSDAIIVAERERIARSLECFEAGMDFADALHISLTGDGETFVTFDRDLVKLAQKHINTVSVELAS
ncbi:type II toxin-antitoxin system VapC family toxin [Rhizobium sp. 18055]|uniref:type II toxin-antitoxin system VapC family toxin n=1 Tax=Rhizobium sp. 18055 TaxID=2681403 RepID=UPI00135A9EB7|nr:type II toxin-antitoxin system VapC family toxin [Rhizobium sp. 18055]